MLLQLVNMSIRSIQAILLSVSVLSLGAAGSCASPSSPPSELCVVPPGRLVEDLTDLRVGKTGGDGCERVGGTRFNVAAGQVSAYVTWTDPLAILKAELWTDNFGRLVAVGTPASGRQCVTTKAPSDGGAIVIRVCHTRESRVPVADPSDANAFTAYRLVVVQ